LYLSVTLQIASGLGLLPTAACVTCGTYIYVFYFIYVTRKSCAPLLPATLRPYRSCGLCVYSPEPSRWTFPHRSPFSAQSKVGISKFELLGDRGEGGGGKPRGKNGEYRELSHPVVRHWFSNSENFYSPDASRRIGVRTKPKNKKK